MLVQYQLYLPNDNHWICQEKNTNGFVIVVSSAVNITQHILSLQTYMIEDVEATEMILDLTLIQETQWTKTCDCVGSSKHIRQS